MLNLQNRHGDLGVRQDVRDELRLEVGKTDAPDEAVGVLGGLHHVLQGLPRLGDGYLGEGRDLAMLLVGPEARPAELLEGNELEGNGEVNQE